MGEMMNTVVISCAIVLVLIALKVVNIVWVRPKKLEKLLKQQGFKGNDYRFLFGDMKELKSMFQEAISEPLNIDDRQGVLRRVVPILHHSHKKYGKNFTMWLGWKPRAHIMDPELINYIFLKSNEFQKVRSNPFVKFIATGLVSYEGDQWAKHRKLLNPAFHTEKLKGMLPAFHLSCSEMIRNWEKVISSKEEEACELDVWPHLQALTSDALSRTSFGSSYEEGIRIFKLIKEQSELTLQAAQSIYIPGFWYLPTKRNRRMKAIDNEVQASIRSIIDKRRKALNSGEVNNDDLLGTLLDSNAKEIELHGNKSYGMSIKEVIEECKVFYFAGQETTSSLLVWTMFMLSKHQEWQSRAREEVLMVFDNKHFDADGLNKLKVVTMIFHEVLRMYPPIPGLARHVCKDMTLGEIFLPAGLEVGLPIILLHYDKEIWGEDVMEFMPERFSEGVSKATNNQHVYFPFGAGPRICIGQNFAMMEAKLALAMILQNFSFELSPSYVHAPHTSLIIQPQFGTHLILRKL